MTNFPDVAARHPNIPQDGFDEMPEPRQPGVRKMAGDPLVQLVDDLGKQIFVFRFARALEPKPGAHRRATNALHKIEGLIRAWVATSPVVDEDLDVVFPTVDVYNRAPRRGKAVPLPLPAVSVSWGETRL